ASPRRRGREGPSTEPPHDRRGDDQEPDALDHHALMTIRSRPVLDRKHRPRWQDELRTQQLTVLGFALAIALALGMFGAAAWNGYWETRLRPVATVGETTFVRGDLATREGIITAEILAQVTELQSRLDGGPRDAAIQAQVDSLS